MARTVNTQNQGNGLLLNLILFIPSLILYLYDFLIRIPNFRSHLLGIIRVAFWGTLFFAFVNDNATTFPYVVWGPVYDSFTANYPLLSALTDIFMIINIIVQLFVAGGMSLGMDNYTRGIIRDGLTSGRITFSNNRASDYPNISEGMGYLDALLGQESSRGKVEYMRKMFGGK